MKKLSLKVKTELLASFDINKLIYCLKNFRNKSFKYNASTSKMVSDEMRKDTICSKWSEYLIFDSELENLFQAKVFLRLNDEGLELFNINSDNPKYSILTDGQYNIIVNEFNKFMGESISLLFDVYESK